MKVNEILKLLSKDGWRVVRQTGRQRQLQHESSKEELCTWVEVKVPQPV
jgi:predicted RNA binding protein YcfA (HicA-like mRNA interferase family)